MPTETDWYLDREESPAGPEHDLVSHFAEYRGWQVEWAVLDTVADVLQALQEGEAHMAAAGLTHLPSRDVRFLPGPSHTAIVEQLVCHREARPLPRSSAAADAAIEAMENRHYGYIGEFDGRYFERRRLLEPYTETGCLVGDQLQASGEFSTSISRSAAT